VAFFRERDRVFIADDAALTLTVRQADVREDDAFEERDYFDLAHCQLSFMWMADPVAVLRRMAASLRPGGVLLAEEGNFDLQSSSAIPRKSS